MKLTVKRTLINNQIDKPIYKVYNEDNLEVTCPFQTKIPFQDHLGNSGVMEESCSSKCRFFTLNIHRDIMIPGCKIVDK
jgi:hypothetical protein